MDRTMECPVCWEVFNDASNAPHVLWCGHSLCRTCILGLQWAVLKFPSIQLQLPLCISCPWCQFMTCRIVWKGSLKYPCKNYVLLWILDGVRGGNGAQSSSRDGSERAAFADAKVQVISPVVGSRQAPRSQNQSIQYLQSGNFRLYFWSRLWLWQDLFMSSVGVFARSVGKLPMVMIFLFLLCCVIPFSTFIIVVYSFCTLVVAIPYFIVLYFSVACLGWLTRRIAS